jgi:hypothetical protein
MLSLTESLAGLPLLTNGWNELREYYKIEGLQQINFDFTGQKCFLINFGKIIQNSNKLSSFHSRSTKEKRTFFGITLNQLQMANPTQMVNSNLFYD